MNSYRLYLQNRRGRVIDSVGLLYETDAAAEAEVQAHLQGGRAELWSEGALVRRFSPVGLDAWLTSQRS